MEPMGAAKVLADYEDFQQWYYEQQLQDGFSEEDIQDYSVTELLDAMLGWTLLQ